MTSRPILKILSTCRRVAVFTLFLIVASSAITGPEQPAQAQGKEPISEERLITLLAEKVSFPKIIEAIKERGVSFQTFQPFVDEIKEAGRYLGTNQLNILLATVSDNYRPPDPPPYRVTFRSLKGVAANLLLDKKIDREWDEALGTGDYYIFKNEVLKSLVGLMRRFSSRNFGQRDFDAESSAVEGRLPSNEKLARLYRIQRRPLFIGSTGEPDGSGFADAGVGTDDAAGLIRSLNDQNRQWRLIEIAPDPAPPKKNRSPIDVYTFRKFVEKNELSLFAPTRLAAFYSYITRDYLPPDFATVELAIHRIEEEEEEGCEEATKYGPLLTSAGLIGPLLSLNVAIVENISKEPIRTGRLFVKANNVETLRTRNQNRASLDSAPFKTLELFSSGILKPGEKVVIPIDLSLANEDWDAWDTPPESADNPETFVTELSRLRKAGGLRFPGFGRRLLAGAESIERMLRSSKIDFSKTPEYLYGPSVSLEALEINSYGYLVRDFDPTKLNITPFGQETGGSCPYVYTYSAEHGKWVNEGVILYGHNAKIKEAVDEIPLRRFDGRLLIREQDPEDSFIDLVQIRATFADGSTTLLHPRDAKLRTADGNYIQLRQGQQVIIDFEIPAGFVAEKYYLVTSGYYIPYDKKPIKSDRPRTPTHVRRLSSYIRTWRRQK